MPTMNNLKTSSSAARPTRLVRLAALGLLLGSVTVGALAQYKIVGPDGKVTYTDKPPTPADIRMPQGTQAPAANGALPYETRTAVGKYPVTLYATQGCPACDQARQALKQRGVPFSEYSVISDADVAALQARFGGTTLPVIAIGSQSVKGYSAGNLSGYLDAAGYPAQARLTGYSWPAAAPLAPVSAVAPAARAAATPPAPAAPVPAPASKDGIQF
jgi:glutaredoxin